MNITMNKRLRWFKEGELIPFNATLVKTKEVVDKWSSDHDLLPDYASKTHTEYLYEIPVFVTPTESRGE